MYAFPELDIYFPESDETALVAQMRERAGGLWTWQPHNPFGRPAADGQYFFHRDADEVAPPCTVCLGRRKPGHLWVPCVTPDSYGVDNLDVMSVIRDFDRQIAAPAAEEVDGMTTIGTDTHTLEDYYSQSSINLLESFCKGSNAGDLGRHPNDQRRWRAFLLHVFRNEKERPSGDQLGELLREKGDWWPEYGIRDLASEYNFAMELLEQAKESISD